MVQPPTQGPMPTYPQTMPAYPQAMRTKSHMSPLLIVGIIIIVVLLSSAALYYLVVGFDGSPFDSEPTNDEYRLDAISAEWSPQSAYSDDRKLTITLRFTNIQDADILTDTYTILDDLSAYGPTHFFITTSDGIVTHPDDMYCWSIDMPDRLNPGESGEFTIGYWVPNGVDVVKLEYVMEYMDNDPDNRIEIPLPFIPSRS